MRLSFNRIALKFHCGGVGGWVRWLVIVAAFHSSENCNRTSTTTPTHPSADQPTPCSAAVPAAGGGWQDGRMWWRSIKVNEWTKQFPPSSPISLRSVLISLSNSIIPPVSWCDYTNVYVCRCTWWWIHFVGVRMDMKSLHSFPFLGSLIKLSRVLSVLLLLLLSLLLLCVLCALFKREAVEWVGVIKGCLAWHGLMD